METNEGLELATKLGDFVNTLSMKGRSEDFIKGFSQQHRTLQQSSFRLILELIEFMASDEYRTDPRNQDSKKVAQMLLQGFQKVNGTENYPAEHFPPSKYLSFV